MPTITELVTEVIQKEYLESHGCHAFDKLNSAIGKKKTKTILKDLKTSFYQDPIEWSKVKDHVWSTEDERLKNKYLFLQGDILKTELVISLGQSRFNQTHDSWLVCSPTCDIARGPDYVRVAKIFRIDMTDTDKNKIGTKEYEGYKKLSLGTKFANTKFFPLPSFPNDLPETFGYYADLETPYYLERDKMSLAIVKHSLKFLSWHFLNIFLMEKDTRSNPSDEPEIRCHAEGISVPELQREEVRIYHGEGKEEYRVVANDFVGEDHKSFLVDNDNFKGIWVKSTQKEAYWFFKDGIDHKKVIKEI